MIDLTHVTKSFGSNHVLRGVDLHVGKGRSMVVIGGSGTGKSILIKCILGLVRPDGGTIMVDGQDVTKVPRDAFLARFGMLFQGGALFDSLPSGRTWPSGSCAGPSPGPGPRPAPSPSTNSPASASGRMWPSVSRRVVGRDAETGGPRPGDLRRARDHLL
jgi:hypothetical protein